MGVLRNDVGRPSDKTIRIRAILKGVLLVIVIGISFALGYLLNQDKNNKVVKNKVVKDIKKNDEKNAIIDIKETFNKYIEEKNLKIRNNDEIFDMESASKINCSAVTSAYNDEYSMEILTFTDNESARKYFGEQKNYHKKDNEVVLASSKKVLDERETSNYELFEMALIADVDGVTFYDYLYSLRINNYYINIYSSAENDNSSEMIKIKNELNSLLKVK